MSLANASRIARRELRGGLSGFWVFLTCLALGVAAIAAVGSVRQSIALGLEREGATILGGDAEIQLTYRFANTAERAWMDSVSNQVSEIVDFRSMAVVGDERGLTQVKGIDDVYPLYGAPVLDPEIPLSDALNGADGLPRTDALDASGLLAPGTLFETAYRLKLPANRDLETLEQQAQTQLDGAGLRWRDARNGAPGVAEFVDRLGAFLVLVGLAGLAVGGIGVSAAVRSYLDQKTDIIATLKTLGAETRTIFLAYGLQIAILTLAGIALGLFLGAVVPLIFAPLIEARLPIPAVFTLHPKALAEAALYGVLAAAVFTLWPLAKTENIRAATLYRDGTGGTKSRPSWRYLAVITVLLAALVFSAATFSGLFTLTIWASGGLMLAFLALILVAWFTRVLAKRLARASPLRGRTAVRMALGSVGGPGSEAGSIVLSLGLGLTVLAAVGQIDANIRGAIDRDLPDIAPSFFVVDIQSDQLPIFLDSMNADTQVSRVETAPMLRGVITKVNGQPAMDVAGDHWVLQGDRGITYSALPPSGAEITEGTWWDANHTGSPEISFAAEEAVEMGLSLGDTLTLNVLGRDITADITSFREVDFSTAGIGFILSMNPSALAGAPHTHIATIYGDEQADARLLREVGKAYPNMTMIRVRDAIARVTDILGGIAAATTYGALASLLTGFVVLIGAAAAGEQARTYEAAILKTLGASRSMILLNFAYRSAIFGLAAGVVAVAAGALAGWAVTHFVMEGDFQFEPVSATIIVLGGVLTTLVSGLCFAWRPLASRPAQILRMNE